ncbi:MAG: penicillin acylase family protein [Meiothermus sp.]
MRRVLRFLGRLLLVVLALAAVGGTVGWFWLRGATIAPHDGRLALKGLSAPVEMARESSGVLHIRAETDADVFFALGVAHAQDRLWQMEFQRRVGAGRLSEVLGKATLEQDKFLRTWGFYRAAEQGYASLDAYSKTAVDAYVAGVNAYLATNPPLPPEFKLLGYKPAPWTAADVLVWAKLMAYELSGNWRTELERQAFAAKGLSAQRMDQLRPPYPSDAATVVQAEDYTLPAPPAQTPQTPPFTTLTSGDETSAKRLLELAGTLPPLFRLPGEMKARASNNWVIAGSRTTTGKPLLANDPHLGLSAPSIWYLVDMQAPGYKAVGASFPGLPAVVIGRNERIGWGVTTVGADVMDLYMMDEVSGGYRYKGQVEPWKVRTEVIKVKGEPDVGIKVRESRYGPVINDVAKNAGAKPLSLRWTALDPTDGTMQAFIGIAKAQNWEEFKAALKYYNAPSQNFVYADTDGNIGYMAPARFPIRKPGHSGMRPVPGDGNWDWQGYLPQEQWPQVYNPKEGFIVTANNKVTAPNYPHTISLEWEEPYRAERIRQMILAKDKLSLADMEAMQADITTPLYAAFKPVLGALNPISPGGQAWKTRLLAWDGVANAESQEATMFEAWYTELSRLPAKEVGQPFWEEPRYLLAAMKNGDPNCVVADASQTYTQTCLEYAALAFEKALDRLGSNIPRWGEVHRATFPHQVLTHTPLKRFSDRTVSYGGDRYTVNRASYDPATFTMNVGSSYREILDFSDLENSRFIHPMGQSGNLLSKEYANLLPLWQKVQYLPMKMKDYAVQKRQVLEPVK